MLNTCPECHAKQRRIDQLEDEVKRLKVKLRVQERKAQEGFFGSSTPSAKRPVKETSLEENQKKRGGAKRHHKCHPRKSISVEEADHVHDVEAPVGDCCPHCQGTDFVDVKAIERSVIDSAPVKADKVVYNLKGKLCLGCKHVFRAKPPSVMSKALYGNQLVTNIAVMHYLHGMPMGRLEQQYGISYGAMVDILHRLGRLFEGVKQRLIEEYRQSHVKHADETGWRTDGANGYVWLFATTRISLFEFRDTRSGSVPASILGNKKLPGILVVDRYKGYNKVPCAMQYCYAHLLRNLEDLEKEFPDDVEVRTFVATVAPLLGLAMGLRNQRISDAEFSKQASQVARKLRAAMRRPANHLGIRAYQDIFLDNKQRLYGWSKDRRVPADNNLAERDLRPTVIARKVSFGSQSENGAQTRGVLMSVLVTLKKRYPEDFAARFKSALDQLSLDMKRDPYLLLFPG